MFCQVTGLYKNLNDFIQKWIISNQLYQEIETFLCMQETSFNPNSDLTIFFNFRLLLL